VGLGGLTVAGIAAAVGHDEPTVTTYALGGVGLGVAAIGLATAGILAITLEDSASTIALSAAPTSAALAVSF
jgi:hypothetical protein